MKRIKKIKPFFIDGRGEMNYLIDGEKISSILLITSKKGAVRANHYHKKDSHYSYLLSGKMEYTFYDLKAKNKRKKKIIVKKGDLIYTSPMEAHAMKFLEDSDFLALGGKQRGKGKYEEDLIRIKVI
ncbi:MAG: cupin domain-containing protein [Candidatus Levybacteria bacterium]|nr:cupin domain-containing protein [Candidatus Levybacteria bacterium]